MTAAAIEDRPLSPLRLGLIRFSANKTALGSAAVIVLSQHDRARDIAASMMSFFRHESCGQCTPCRSGTAKAVALMEAAEWDRELMQALSGVMMDASICGLGQAAPNPMLSVLRYFAPEVARDAADERADPVAAAAGEGGQ